MRSLLAAVLLGFALAYSAVPRSTTPYPSSSSSEELDSYDDAGFGHVAYENIEFAGFLHGKEYEFYYDGQIMEGVPGSSRQHSGQRIRCLVRLRIESVEGSDRKCEIKLEKIRMGVLNTEIREPRRTLPFSMFKEVSIESKLLTQLELPFEFIYQIDKKPPSKNSRIRNIRFLSGDKPWSENIKRGILNMLQLDFSQLQEPKPMSTEELPNLDIEDVYEVSLEGKCRTEYYPTLKSPCKISGAGTCYNVTKVIDLEKCKERPEIRYNFRLATPCPNCPDKKYTENQKFLKAMVVQRFNLSETSEGEMLIRSSNIESQYTMVMFNEESSLVTVYINQTLKLRKSMESTQSLMPSSPPAFKPVTSLMYSTEWDKQKERFFMDSTSQEFRENSPFSLVNNPSELIKQELESVSKLAKNRDDISRKMPELLARIVEMMRLLKKEDIKKIFNEVKNPQAAREEKLKREIFLVGVGACGSEACIGALQDPIVPTLKSEPFMVTKILRQLPNIRVPSEKIVEHIKAICKSFPKDSALTKQCYLSLGSVIYAQCGITTYDVRDVFATSDVTASQPEAEKLLKLSQRWRHCKNLDALVLEVISLFNSAESVEEKITFVKMMHNMGVKEVLPQLQKIIYDKKLAMALRVEAIVALRKLAPIYPRLVRDICLRHALQRNEKQLVRSAAFWMLMHAYPTRSELVAVCKVINTEPNNQAATFMYTMLNEVANISNPLWKPIAADVKLALRFCRKLRPALLQSQIIVASMHSRFAKIGIDTAIFTGFSNSSSVPRYWGGSIDANMLGFLQEVFELEVFTEGIDSMLYKLLGNRGLVYENTLSAILKGTLNRPENVATSQELSKLNIVNRLASLPKKVRSWLSLRVLREQSLYLPVPQEYIRMLEEKNVLKKVYDWLQQVRSPNYYYSSLLSESQYKIPTSIGMPLVWRHKLPVVASVQGEIKLEPSQSKMIVKLSPSVAVKSITRLAVWCPVVNNGFKLSATAKLFAPVDMTLVKETKEIKCTVALPKSRRKLIELSSEPITYYRIWPDTIRSWVPSEKKVIYGEEINRASRYETRIGKDLLGFDFYMKVFQHWSPSVPGMPSCPLTGPNHFTLYAEPSSAETMELRLVNETTQYAGEIRPRWSSSFQPKPGYLTKLSAQIKVGTQTPKKVILEAKMSRDHRVWQMETQVVEGTTTKGCLTSEVVYPAKPFKLSDIESSKPLEAKMLIKSGQCSTEASNEFVEIQAKGMRSERQIHIDNLYREEYYRCKKYGKTSPIECYDYLAKAGYLAKYELDVTHKMESPYLKNITMHLYRYLKYAYFPQISVNPLPVQKPPADKINLVLRVDPYTMRRFNLTVRTPQETMRLIEGYTPISIPTVNIKKSLSDYIAPYPRCAIHRDMIETFDKVRYSNPIKGCWTVVAKDCVSPSQFTVLMKNIESSKNQKMVKILLADEPSSYSLILKPEEGNKIKISTGEQSQIFSEGSQSVFIIRKTHPKGDHVTVNCSMEGSYVKCLCPEIGLYVYFDGYACNIKISPLYHSRQCGLCGHFDYQRASEFMTPKMIPTSNVRWFAKSYMLSEQCTLPTEESLCKTPRCEYRPDYKLKTDEPSPYDVPRRRYSEVLSHHSAVTPVPKHVIKGNCISKKPIERCPSHSYAKRTESENVEMLCLNDSILYELADLEENARRREDISGIITAFEATFSSETYTESKKVALHTACLRY